MGNELPEMFSKYFIGQAYLQPLTDKGGAVKIVLGIKHFVVYIVYVMAFSLVTGLVINMIL